MRQYRGYYIKAESPRSYVIVTEGRGGKIPNVLSGSFTDVPTAHKLIDRYLDTKVEKNAKTSDQG